MDYYILPALINTRPFFFSTGLLSHLIPAIHTDTLQLHSTIIHIGRRGSRLFSLFADDIPAYVDWRVEPTESERTEIPSYPFPQSRHVRSTNDSRIAQKCKDQVSLAGQSSVRLRCVELVKQTNKRLLVLTLLLEHVQLLLSQSQEVMNSSIAHYKMILRGIFDTSPIIPQTSTNPEGQPVTSLTSNYLCLQCPVTVEEADRLDHGTEKLHRFCM